MLHVGARTKFILDFLTKEIFVSFSIRQGDPLAMLLYIIYIEPLLLYLERKLVGLRLAGIPQCIEGYCDDINVLTNQASDFTVLDCAVRKFELVSGAILSRNKKCKVMGFGSWKGRTAWPLYYLKTVQEMKVFGIFFVDNYRSMLKRNWDFRFESFMDVIKSWSPRVLDTLTQRVEVLKVFALSRIYYVASVLPINITMVKKFEKEMGKFLWTANGKVLRVSLVELNNSVDRGGQGLPCLMSMCKSLMLSQLLRLLRSGDGRSVSHVVYWIGELLEDLNAEFGVGEHADVVPVYYDFLANLVAESMAAGSVTSENWKSLSNRMIYLEHSQQFPMPKVEVEAGVSFKAVWQRLSSPVLSSSARDILYLLVHNKLPVRERIFRIGLAVDPYCDFCEDAVICDLEHFFCSCLRVSTVWDWLRARLVGVLGWHGAQCSDWDLLNLFLPSSNKEKEAIWLVGTYVTRVWEKIFMRNGAFLEGEEFFGFMRFKYKAAQLGARVVLSTIPGLLD